MLGCSQLQGASLALGRDLGRGLRQGRLGARQQSSSQAKQAEPADNGEAERQQRRRHQNKAEELGVGLGNPDVLNKPLNGV